MTPHPELQRLAPLLGTWRSSDRTQDSVLGPGVPVTSHETFSWLEGGYFLVSTYDTAFGDEPVQKGINYCGYDAETGRFGIVFFSNNGPFTEAGNRYTGVVERDTLTFEGSARFQYALDADGKVARDADGGITTTWWLRDERGDWRPWMSNHHRRVT